MKKMLIDLAIFAVLISAYSTGYADCNNTSIKDVKKAPSSFDGKSIAIFGRLIFSPHGMGIFDVENGYSGFQLEIPKQVWKLPIVDALHVNLFQTKVAFSNEVITGTFCGRFNGKKNVFTLIEIQKLTIEIKKSVAK